MTKIILILILIALGYSAVRRWMTPTVTQRRADEQIPEASWTPVDGGGSEDSRESPGDTGGDGSSGGASDTGGGGDGSSGD